MGCSSSSRVEQCSTALSSFQDASDLKPYGGFHPTESSYKPRDPLNDIEPLATALPKNVGIAPSPLPNNSEHHRTDSFEQGKRKRTPKCTALLTTNSNAVPTKQTSVVSQYKSEQNDFPANKTNGLSDISTTEKLAPYKSLSPREAISPPIAPSVKTNEKIPVSRNTPACRLKKLANITNTYDISSQVLGTGVSGVVRVATHLVTKRQYAIKTLSWEGVNPKRTAMLHNEVSIYLKLDHPNIAKLIEVYESDRAIHLVMELCTGGELYSRLAAKKKYSEKDAAKVSQQMLSAINYCHEHHICHRDLKLENWVYADKSPDAPLKLIDFGFSRIFNPGVPMTAMHGTVYYVSPEVMDGCYKETCDIWSIGVIVYMLLSGSPPFNSSHDHEILIKIKRGIYSLSGPQWEGISEEAKSFVRFLLQKDPDKRPSASEASQHPWLQKWDCMDANINIPLEKPMQNFSLLNVMQNVDMGVLTLGISTEDIAKTESALLELDQSKKGTNQHHDFITILCKALHIGCLEAQGFFEKIQGDIQESHYGEFLTVALQAKYSKDNTLIQKAFQRFDVENKQRITLNNLRSIIGDALYGTRVETILEAYDSNGDGYLDYDEFSRALTSKKEVVIHKNTPVEREHDDKANGTFKEKNGQRLSSLTRLKHVNVDSSAKNGSPPVSYGVTPQTPSYSILKRFCQTAPCT